MRTERRRDTMKVTAAFRNFAKAPDNIHIYVYVCVCIYIYITIQLIDNCISISRRKHAEC